MKTIEILVAKDGSVKMEGKGFAGADCYKATKALEDALGEKVGDAKTSEFYRAEAQKQGQR